MSTPGTSENPLRVAIIGAGPAGFYAAQHLQKQAISVKIDMFDRLPTPFGLVRAGVAPDHQKIKAVTKQFDQVAGHKDFRFFGNVEFGRDLGVADLERCYHQILYSTGAQTDRQLNIPGEGLAGSHPATEFVAWYNGHPDFRDYEFDLSQETAVVIGVGNVAIDVARILCRTPEELATTDIADYALEALKKSRIKTVYVLGRRGPAQAAFTLIEIKEMGELADATAVIPKEDITLDPLSAAWVAEANDRSTNRKLEVMNGFVNEPSAATGKNLIFRFLVSPTELIGNDAGQVTEMKLVHNELYRTDSGTLRPRSTDRTEVIPAGLVFRSIGYRGVPLVGIPFNDDWGVIRNENGRIVEDGTRMTGHYTAGWIKRGPSGVIGTNKADAVETVKLMLEDLAAGQTLTPESLTSAEIGAIIKAKQPDLFTYADWLELDRLETAAGAAQGRPRVKFTTVAEMRAAVSSE